MKLFSITAYDNTYHIHDTYHANERREGASRSRVKFFTIKKLRSIFTTAAKSISQYRGQGRIAITFYNDTGRISSLLVSLQDNNITIITALYNVKRQVNDVFRGVPHYFLSNYIFTKPTDNELRSDWHKRDAYTSSEQAISERKQSTAFSTKYKGISKPKWVK